MRLPAMCQFDSFLVVLSVVFAVRFLSQRYGLPFTSEMRKRGSAGKVSRSRRDGCRDPRHALHGHGRRQFYPLRSANGPVSAVSISTLGRRNCRRHLHRPRPGSADVLVDRRFATQTLEVQEEKLPNRGVFIGSTAIEPTRAVLAGGFPPATSSGPKNPFGFSNTTERRNRPWNSFSGGLIRKTQPSCNRHQRAAHDGQDFDHEFRLVTADGSINMSMLWLMP